MGNWEGEKEEEIEREGREIEDATGSAEGAGFADCNSPHLVLLFSSPFPKVCPDLSPPSLLPATGARFRASIYPFRRERLGVELPAVMGLQCAALLAHFSMVASRVPARHFLYSGWMKQEEF
jgi:hypothetical protein